MKRSEYELEFDSLNRQYNLLKEKEREIQYEEVRVINKMHQCFVNWLKEKTN